MKNSIASFSLALVATLLSASSVAQTRYCIGGDLDHLSANERAECSATLQAVRSAAAAMHAPADWHFVVVCGEQGWKDYTAFSRRGEAALEQASADTDREAQETFFREERLHTAQPHGLQHVVAHEMASILLKTEDENAIQTQMAAWERDSHVQGASLRAQ